MTPKTSKNLKMIKKKKKKKKPPYFSEGSLSKLLAWHQCRLEKLILALRLAANNQANKWVGWGGVGTTF
jgi:hypothetical protein